MAAIGLWAAWVIGLVAALVPATVSLTTVRLLAPGPAVIAAMVLVVDPGWPAAVALAVGAVLALVAFRPEVGRTFVQASAYGDEARYPLRPPGALLLGPLPLLWSTMAAAVVGGPLLLATGQWIAGAAVSLVAVGLAVVLPRRFHLLSRRFLVFVPAGVVLHDPLGLAETAMFPWRAVVSVSRAFADTQALDLTAGALGPAAEVTLSESGTVVRVGRRRGQTSAVHTRAWLCSPSLLDRAIAEAARRQRTRGAAST